jgi:hypothetical protein
MNKQTRNLAKTGEKLEFSPISVGISAGRHVGAWSLPGVRVGLTYSWLNRHRNLYQRMAARFDFEEIRLPGRNAILNALT